MSPLRSTAYLAIMLVVVFGMIGPAAAIDFPAAESTTTDSLQVDPNATVSNHTEINETDNDTVTVGVGQQLSTIITATSDDTQTGIENIAFEIEFEAGNETERAEAVAERAEELRDRADDIRDDYENATEAYEAGELTRDEYAQRIATLNARAENVLSSLETLQQRTQNLSALELRAVGVNQTRLQSVIANLDSVTGLGPSALLQQFVGVGEGSIELETADGLSIEVKSEDGERSREVKRSRDGDTSIAINGSEALSTARAALSEQAGEWRLLKSSVHLDEGYYKFEFAFRTANETGEAELRVDGSSGAVFRLEEEIESLNESDPADDGDDLNETEDDEDELEDLAVVVASGSPGPGAEITIQVLAPNGSGVANVTVRLNDTVVGTTDADGRLTLTLPATEAEIEATRGDADGELEFEFEAEEDDDDVFRNLDVGVTINDGSATVTVSYNGSPVSGAKVYANDEFAGKTGGNGTVQISISNDTDELEIEVVKGEFEAELEFELANGEANQNEDAHEGDGDKIEDDEDDEEETDTPEGDEDDEEETDTPEDDEDDEEETDTPEDDEDDEEETDTPEGDEDDEEETDTPEDDY